MSTAQPKDAFEERLRRAHAALRAGQAATAERGLRSLEGEFPGEVNCLWLLGVALLDQGRVPESIALLERSLAAAPEFAEARVDLARAYRRAGRAGEARAEVRRVLEKTPHHHRAWLAYGDVLVDLGQYDDARVAFERARLTDPERQRIEEASAALAADDRRSSEELFREILRRDASHVGALCGLAAVSLAADAHGDAERLLRHALRQSEHLPLAYRGLGPALLALGRVEEADAAAQHLLKVEPENPQSWITKAAVASRFMRQEAALEAYERAARYQPGDVRLLMSIGHVRKSLGRRAESEASYKEVLAADPGNAEAWWSLADLKSYSFDDDEVAAMQRLIADRERAGRARPGDAQLYFALGRALEQHGRYPQAFASYAQGNALRRRDAPFDIEGFERRAARIRAFFSTAFFAAHAGGGDPSSAPIFIVGLPRSGSTLIEQILASHSRVDGTMELPNIINLVRAFEDQAPNRDGYPEAVGGASVAQLAALGSRYVAETAPLRRGRAHFTDKLPNNFSHVGLIQAILPHATIVDARRHPMDACFSTFKQHFASGQTFSYDLEDLGRYYRCYLSLMDHWDAALPGKVLHVQYEELVRDPEASIRRLLEHCGLPFEPACLNFHETSRPVRTPSAEQVRRPIYTQAVGYWRHFENELEPLRLALGACLERFG
ncbi:MAG TPA: sulfotransferase [Steroidobacteraceae bacterium]|nr:sulfotransferase [Steroidobacteraceae bacterium]